LGQAEGNKLFPVNFLNLIALLHSINVWACSNNTFNLQNFVAEDAFKRRTYGFTICNIDGNVSFPGKF
jgi:hypothetical protein